MSHALAKQVASLQADLATAHRLSAERETKLHEAERQRDELAKALRDSRPYIAGTKAFRIIDQALARLTGERP